MIRFDIGCNHGQWIDRNYNPIDFFVGIEANPKTYKAVVEKYTTYSNILIRNFAVCDKDDCLVEFYPEVNDPASVASTASEFWRTEGRFAGDCLWPQSIKVPGITLDSLITMYGMPSEIKIDVEGFEYEVIKGLSQTAGKISFEWTEELNYITAKCLHHLYSLGYNDFAIVEEDKEEPEKYESLRDVIYILNSYNGINKEKWGMIYANV